MPFFAASMAGVCADDAEMKTKSAIEIKLRTKTMTIRITMKAVRSDDQTTRDTDTMIKKKKTVMTVMKTKTRKTRKKGKSVTEKTLNMMMMIMKRRRKKNTEEEPPTTTHFVVYVFSRRLSTIVAP